MTRTGDEPMHARSPLGLRLGLALVGLGCGGWLAVRWWSEGRAAWAAIGVAVALIAAVNAVVVLRRFRAGAHFQPGRDVPPYQPVNPARRTGGAPPDVPERVRLRRYLILMGICLSLITVAWVWVRLVSVPLAIAMSLVAMVIPPVASFVANIGWTGRDADPHDTRPPDGGDDAGR